MTIEVTSHNVKSLAKKLRSALSDYQLELKHSQSLEIIAKTFGLKDWNTLSAKLMETSQFNSYQSQSGDHPDNIGHAAEWMKKERQIEERKLYYEAAITDMNFVLIPAGDVQLSEDYSAEIIQDFYLGDHPVTCGEFNPYLMDKRKKLIDENLKNTPVVDISWMNAQDYIAWLNGFGEEIYRLPTEAEWEYACKAGTTTTYSFGDSREDLHKYGWYYSNAGEQLRPVKQLLPNPWELYDMHGNVLEWVQDFFKEYPCGHIKDPTGPRTGRDRVLRGGAWTDGNPNFYSTDQNVIPLRLGSQDRNGCSPISSRNFIGFRLVKQKSIKLS